MDTAKARAQAVEALDEAAGALKRQIGVSRRALQTIRQAQAAVTGIDINTDLGGQSGNSTPEARAA